MDKIVIALDVGGTSVKSMAVRGTTVLEQTRETFPSLAKESKETLLAHFISMIKTQADKLNPAGPIAGIALAFPGPFDYDGGVSLLKGIDKFDALYGVNLREEFTERISGDPQLNRRFSDPMRVVFGNDVTCFALGELHLGQIDPAGKTLCLTIGTGAGSCFPEGGRPVTDRPGVPENGWIYSLPFRDSTIDDYVSKRGIGRLAEQRGLGGTDAKQLADLARAGSLPASEVFEQFGTLCAEALNPVLAGFQPATLVIGGQIAKSFDLCRPAFLARLSHVPRIVLESDTSQAACVGAASLVLSAIE